jgi:hypothetical protein
MLDHADQDNSHDGKALRDEAEYASLTRRAATDNSRVLVDQVLRLITRTEPRERQRGAKANASFRQAVEGFLGDLLAAKGRTLLKYTRTLCSLEQGSWQGWPGTHRRQARKQITNDGYA